MFKPVSMSKVRIFVLKNDMNKVLSMLYDLKLMEFFSVKNAKFEQVGAEEHEKDSGDLLKLRSTITLLKPFFTKEVSGKEEEEQVMKKTFELESQYSKISKELLFIEDAKRRKAVIKGLNIKEKDLKDPKISIGFLHSKSPLDLKVLDKAGIRYRSTTFDERLYFIAYSKDIPLHFTPFYLPQKVDAHLEQKLAKERALKKTLFAELKELANENLRHLQRKELKLSKQVSSEEAKNHLIASKNITVLNGYIPNALVKKLRSNLERELADSFEMEAEPAKDAPSLLQNITGADKFETLLKMYSLPKYGEFDPSFIMFLIFPLFFGFVLGDVGYGLVSLFAFSLAKLKYKNLKDFLSILQLSALSSILFGIIYGEYFGFEPYHIFSRTENVMALLLIAVGFGVVHINMGLLIGFYNTRHHLKHAICDKLSWIILQLGVALAILGSIGESSGLFYAGLATVLLAVVLIFIGHGFVGLIELPSIFSNILSYARLMAVGFSSIVIAIMVNEFSIPLFEAGLLPALGGVLLFVVGHVFNIVLGNFESFLHTLRLHYVEFFTKFYSGGGREFKPFGQRDLDSEE